MPHWQLLALPADWGSAFVALVVLVVVVIVVTVVLGRPSHPSCCHCRCRGLVVVVIVVQVVVTRSRGDMSWKYMQKIGRGDLAHWRDEKHWGNDRLAVLDVLHG